MSRKYQYDLTTIAVHKSVYDQLTELKRKLSKINHRHYSFNDVINFLINNLE